MQSQTISVQNTKEQEGMEMKTEKIHSYIKQLQRIETFIKKFESGNREHSDSDIKNLKIHTYWQ